MSIVIQNAADLTQPWTSWFFYGATGSGKTRAAATFPAPFFIVPQNEKSINTLRGMNVPYTEVFDRNSMFAALSWLENQYAAMQRALSQGKDEEADRLFPYQTIVVESISHYSDLVIEDLTNKGTKQMDYQQWGRLASHLRTIQNRLRAMDVHSIFTSLDQTNEDGTVGGPLISGQTKVKMPSACDYIGYFEAVTVSRKTAYNSHWRQYGKFFARVRQSELHAKDVGEFPAMIESFHFSKVAKYIGLEG